MEAKNKETTHSPEPAEKTICLVQLTRFGDLIQTMQVAKKLKTSRKDIRVTLVARKRFADPLRFLLEDVFDEIFTFDYNLLTNSESSTLDGTLENIDSFLNKVSEKPISALVNLSFSKPSGYLSTLIKAEFKIGVHYDNNSNLIVDDNWSQFVYSNVLGNNLNPFNLIDLYSNIIGVEKESDLPLAKKGTQKRILIHPFASLSRKRWKISKWSELVYKLLKDDPEVTVNIAGGKEDVSDVDVLLKNPILKEFSPRIKNHVGTKSIENIYDLLDNIDLFIGHDSMVGHLASLKQVQTITVSLGSVRPGETTPYQAGAYVLSPRTKCFPCQPTEKCELFQCHSDISYQVAYSVVEQIIRNGEIDMSVLSKNISSFHLSSVNIHRACFSSNGYYRLESMTQNVPDVKDVFREMYRITWAFLLEDKDESAPYPHLNQASHQTLLNSIQSFQHLFELSEFGKKYTKYILQEVTAETPDIAKIKELGKKVDEIDHLKQMLATTNPFLSPITDFYRMKKGNIKGENIVQLTESSYLVYDECSSVCSVMYELVEKVIAEYKINSGVKSINKQTNV